MNTKITIIGASISGLLLMSASAFSQESRISLEDIYGCVDRSYFQEISNSDGSEFKKLLSSGLNSGRCTWFDVGERVLVTDSATFSGVGIVKLKKSGSSKGYWTFKAAIQ